MCMFCLTVDILQVFRVVPVDLHGWPKSYSASSYSGGTIFSESLRYASPQKSGSFGLWSGMVSEYQSQLYGGSVRTYDYFYDNASRLDSIPKSVSG